MTIIRQIFGRYASALPTGMPFWSYPAILALAILWVSTATQTYIFLGSIAFILAIAGMGLLVLVGWGGEVSLAQASLVGTAIYISGYANRPDGFDWAFLPAAGLGLAAVIALSLLISLPTAKLSGIYVMVLTLGLQVTLERTLFTDADLAGGVESVYVSRPSFLGFSFESDYAYYFLVLTALVLVIVSLTLFRHSRHGRALMMVGRDRRAASAMGISPWRYKILGFVIAGVLAGIAGALTTPLYRSPPTPLNYISVQSLFYLAVPVTAGFGSLIGVVLVALVFSMVPHAMEEFWRVSPLLLGGLGLMAGTYAGPGGFSGLVLDRIKSKREAVIFRAGDTAIEAPRPPEGSASETPEGVEWVTS